MPRLRGIRQAVRRAAFLRPGEVPASFFGVRRTGGFCFPNSARHNSRSYAGSARIPCLAILAIYSILARRSSGVMSGLPFNSARLAQFEDDIVRVTNDVDEPVENGRALMAPGPGQVDTDASTVRRVEALQATLQLARR